MTNKFAFNLRLSSYFNLRLQFIKMILLEYFTRIFYSMLNGYRLGNTVTMRPEKFSPKIRLHCHFPYLRYFGSRILLVPCRSFPLNKKAKKTS